MAIIRYGDKDEIPSVQRRGSIGGDPGAKIAQHDEDRNQGASIRDQQRPHQKRGRPRLEDKAKTAEARRPWQELGMSRATWYRRQAEKKEQAK
jgi:hypothetical protein